MAIRSARVWRHERVVVLGAWRQSLAVVRSLGEAGFRVLVARRRGGDYLLASRFAAGGIDLSLDGGSPCSFAAALEQLTPSSDAPVFLLPTGDSEIAGLIRCEADLPAHVVPVVASRDAIAACANKVRLLDVAEGAGVPCVRTVTADETRGLLLAAKEVGFPCVVKSETQAMRVLEEKAVILSSEGEARRRFPGGHRLEGRVLVQAYFAGRRVNVYFFAVEGRPVADCFVEIRRTDQPDGTGLAIDGVTVDALPIIREYTRRLIEALRYDGAGCAQFLVDPESGSATFLEVNARLGANFAVARRSGLDLPLLMIEHAAGRDVLPLVPSSVEVGVRYAWLTGDLEGLLRFVRGPDATAAGFLRWLTQMLRSQTLAGMHITWDPTDPGPTVRMWLDRLLPGRQRPAL